MAIIRISSAEELEIIRQNPSGRFSLEADIDLGGADWTPFDFDGEFSGNGHTISHLRITRAVNGGRQGLFAIVGSGACISALQLAYLQIAVADDAEAVGAFAGENRGHIEGCKVGLPAPTYPSLRGNRNILCGDCDDSWLRSADNTAAAIGAIAGINTGVVTDALSYMQLLVPQKKHRLCGSGDAQGLCRDMSERTSLHSPVSIPMRKKIVDYMFRMGDIKWIPSKDMLFTSAYSSTRKLYGKNIVHYGLPYTQKFGTLERFERFVTTDGYISEELVDYSDAADTDPANTQPGWDVYLGTDCSGAVFWSWAQACPSVSFEYTGHMVPTDENTRTYGVIKVGEYICESENTEEEIKKNNSSNIFECYARLKMADAIVQRNTEHGHTRLVYSDPVVMRREDGNIDPDLSYVPTHEQGVGKGSSGRESTWQLNCRYTFNELLETGYFPITNAELREGCAPAIEIKVKKARDFTDTEIVSNYRIQKTTLKLTSETDGRVYESEAFATVINKHLDDPGEGDNIARGTVNHVKLLAHRRNLDRIPKGCYSYVISVMTACGCELAVSKGRCDI